jgi:hypothetical protein
VYSEAFHKVFLGRRQIIDAALFLYHRGMTSMKRFESVLSVALLVVFATLVGCGQSGPARSAVKGTVKAPDGKPVEGGALVFVPVTTDPNAPSAPVTATINKDGTFDVQGGVVAGKHKVMFEAPTIQYDPPEWDGKGNPPQAPVSPYNGMKVKQQEVDIAASGANDLTIELLPAGG